MQFTADDKKKIADYYDHCLKKHGVDEAEALSWSSRESQQIRFEALMRVGDLERKSILDVGCGLGDLYPYLKSTISGFDYLGIDLVPEMVEKAKIKYPAAAFENKDVLDFNGRTFDFVLSSGAMSFKVPNHKAKYYAMIRKMFDLSRVGTSFNMLDREGHVDNELYAAYESAEIFNFCQTLTSKLRLLKDYSPQDFTIFLYH